MGQKSKMSRQNDVLHVGIDLGTSHSSISASNGERHTVDSYVGWPVDSVARKVAKKPILFGREALEHRTLLDLRRPLDRGLIKEGSARDEAAVRELLRHLITLAGVGEGQPLRAVVGVPAEALRVSQAHLREAVKGTAEAVMVVSEPFAVAYGIDALLHTMIIDIGAGTTDFCVTSGRYPTEEEQRTLTYAGDWVDEQLAGLVRAREPEARLSMPVVRAWKEQWSFVGEPQGSVVVSVLVGGKSIALDITGEMRRACEGLIPPIAETMVDLLARVELEFQEAVRKNVILAGRGSLIPGLAERLERVLDEVGGGKVRAVEDPIFAGSNGSLALALDSGEADWKQLAG